MLEIRQLNYKIKDKTLFNEVSFKISSSKIYYLLGENGSGKTTLAKIINKEIKVPNNHVFFNGIDINLIKTDELRRDYISYLEQENFIYNECTLNQLLDTFSTDLNDINVLIESLEFDHLRNKKLKKMSGGERQKALIIFALSKSTPLIIMDEFDNNLDTDSVETINEYIKKKDKIFIIISHNNSGDNDLVLKDQKIEFIAEEDSTKEITKNNKFSLLKLLKFNNQQYIFFKILFVLAISLVIFIQLFVGHKYLSMVNESYGPQPERAQTTENNVVVAFAPITASYGSFDATETISKSSDDLFFDEADIEKIEESETVSSVETFAYPYATNYSGTIIDTDLTLNYEYSYVNEEGSVQDVVLGISNLTTKNYMYEGMNSLYTYEILYGMYPEDETNQVMIPSSLVESLIQEGQIIGYEEIINQPITFNCTSVETGDVVPYTFVISGIYKDDSTNSYIHISYHEDSIDVLYNDYNKALTTFNTEEIYNNAYSDAQTRFSFANKEIDYNEFVNNNSDLIEAVYIEVENPGDVEVVTDQILNAYPNAVIYSKEIFETHAPLYTSTSYVTKVVTKMIPILLILFLFLILICHSYNLKHKNTRTIFKKQGVSLRSLIAVNIVDYIIPVILSFILLVFFNNRIGFGPIDYISFYIFSFTVIVINIVVIESSIGISNLISKVYRNVKNK